MEPASAFSLVAIALLLLNANDPEPCVQPKDRPTGFLHSIGIVFDDAEIRPTVRKAVQQWQRCRNYGSSFPPFLVGREGQRTIRLSIVESRDGRRCGALIGNRIVVYRRALSPSGLPASCGPPERVLAHELGHVLGLADLHGKPECRHFVMSQTSSQNAHTRSVRAEECEAVGDQWLNGMDTDRLAELGVASPPEPDGG